MDSCRSGGILASVTFSKGRHMLRKGALRVATHNGGTGNRPLTAWQALEARLALAADASSCTSQPAAAEFASLAAARQAQFSSLWVGKSQLDSLATVATDTIATPPPSIAAVPPAPPLNTHRDISMFTVAKQSVVEISAHALGEVKAEVFLTLYNQAGEFLTESVDADEEGVSHIVISLAPGNYTVHADSDSRVSSGSNEIIITQTPVPDREGSLFTIGAVSYRDTGILDYPGDVDTYSIVVTEPTIVRLDTQGSDFDYANTTLRDARGNTVANGEFGVSTLNRLTYQLAPGVYHYEVSAYFAESTGRYRFTATAVADREGGVLNFVNGVAQGSSSINAANDVDSFQLNFDTAELVEFTFSSPNVYAQLSLLDAAGKLVGSGSFASSGNGVTLVASVQPGQYTLQIQPYYQTGTFTIRGVLDPPDTEGGAIPVSTPSTFYSLSGGIQSAGDQDVFSFTLTTASQVTAQLQSSGFSPRVVLTRSNGEKVTGDSIDFNGQKYSILNLVEEPGEYTLTVSSENGDEVGGYSFFVSMGPPDFEGRQLNLNDGEDQASASIDFENDSDFFYFNLTEAKNVSLSVESDSLFTIIRLYDPLTGQVLVESQDNGTLQSSITTSLQPGFYTVGISSRIAGTQGGYTLTARAGNAIADPARVGADFDGNGRVDLWDFALVRNNFGKLGGFDQGDANRDGRIDVIDFALVRNSWDPAA